MVLPEPYPSTIAKSNAAVSPLLHLVYEHHQLPEVQLVKHPNRQYTLTGPCGYDDLSSAVVGARRGSDEAGASLCDPVSRARFAAFLGVDVRCQLQPLWICGKQTRWQDMALNKYRR